MKARMMMMVVLAALLLAASQVWAQEDGSFTVGGGFWSQTNPEAKFREYRDIPRGAFLSDYVLREFNGPWAGAVWGSGPTRADQTNSMYLAKGVTWRLDASFTGTPHLFSQVAHSPYAQNTRGVFTLSDSLQRQLQNLTQSGANPAQNRALSDLLRSAPGVPLGIQTDVTKIRLRQRPIKDWQFEVKGTDRERSGSQALGATLGGPGGPAVELPSPISQRTLDVDATAAYAHGEAKVMATVGVSKFTNDVTSIRFDNFKVFNTAYPGTSTAGRSANNAMSTAPDNEVVRGRFVGSWQLPYKSTFTATLGISQTTQRQAFVPMTVNDTILYRSTRVRDSLALERPNLDGKVMDIVQDYRLTGRPIANFYGTLRFRQEKMDDQTAPLGMPFGFVNYDQAWSYAPVETEAASNTKNVFGFDGDFSLMEQVDVSVLAERRTRELPDWREVTKDAENVFGAKLHLRPAGNVDAAFGYQWAQRRADAFDVDAYDGGEWTGLRRYDVADRDQSKFDGSVSWSPNEKLDLSVNGWWSKDDYPDSLGLNSVDNAQVFGEGTVHLVKNFDVSGGFGYGEQTSKQFSIEYGAPPFSPDSAMAPWHASLKDKNVYAFAKLDWWTTSKKLQVTLDYTFIRDMQSYDFTNKPVAHSSFATGSIATATALDLANAFNRTSDVMLTANWHYTQQLIVGCTYGYTKYDVTDPLYQGIPYLNVNPLNAGTAASGLFLGNNKLAYKAHRFQIRATRRF